jgi:membrane protease YdiL (CAAX protease family)
VIAARPATALRAPALVFVVAAAAAARALLGGSAPATSVPAAAVFTAALGGGAVWAGARLTRVRWSGVALGVAGAVALVAVSLAAAPAVHLGPRASTTTLLWWIPLVTAVAAAEEIVLRGVLFDALRSLSGDVLAVAVTAVLFALIHVPLYGPPALGIDLCVGVFLGCLRVASGGVAAPLVTHVLADLATGWLG